MQKFINGNLYDTERATAIAQDEGGNKILEAIFGLDARAVLFKTSGTITGGHFFFFNAYDNKITAVSQSLARQFAARLLSAAEMVEYFGAPEAA